MLAQTGMIMVVNRTGKNLDAIGATEMIDFAGDNVHLAGQIDYPECNRPSGGYPLIFIIQHSTSTSRADYKHVCSLGMSIGAAVFRWDKRGTGKSGNGSSGSIESDTLKAYEFAPGLPSIRPLKGDYFCSERRHTASGAGI